MPRSSRPSIRPTRRRFLQQAGAASLVASFSSAPGGSASSLFAPTPAPPLTSIPNRAPLAPNAFNPLPLGSIKPTGWLRTQLEIQASGLSGHLDETWPDVGPNSGWLGGKGESWERGPYYLDGLIPLAWQLDDARLKAKAQRYIDWTLQSQAPSGIFGPATNDDWWPRMVMLKALTQYHEYSHDPRVLPLMARYFTYQLAELPKRPLRDWGKFRWQDNALSVLWLYNRTDNVERNSQLNAELAPKLLDLVRLLHQQGYDWVGEFDHFPYKDRITSEYIKLDKDEGLKDLALATHGVNNGQAIKTGPVWSVISGQDSDRRAVLKMLAELDQYHGLPNGMFSCDEHLAGRNPSQGSELCTVVETMFSLEQSLLILGDPALADRLEQLAYNALPGTLSDDMWTHQYNQEPNQVECSLHHKPWTTDGPESNLFGLEPNFGCCTANYHQGWPKFSNYLFLSTPADASSPAGLAAALYAPGEVSTTLESGIPIRLRTETTYPFHNRIQITVDPATPIAFPLSLRIPAWATAATIRVNGQPQPTPTPGSFARIHRTWKPNDRVELTLPMQPRVEHGFNHSVSIHRGPLLFSLPIGESWVKLRDRGLTADWQIFPTTPWNYALAGLSPSAFEVTESTPGPHPFSAKPTPAVHIKVKARKLPAWRAEDGAANPVPTSPISLDSAPSTEPEETITLIPYAAAKLRISAFPYFGDTLPQAPRQPA